MSEAESHDDIDFLGLLHVALDARWLILGVILVALAIGVVYAFLRPPVYRADTLIQVEQNQNDANNVLGELATVFDVQSPASAEIEILRSRLVVGQAADAMQLYVSAQPNYLPVVGQWLAERATALTEPGFFGYGGYVWGTEAINVTQLDVPAGLEGKQLVLRVTPTGYVLMAPNGQQLAEGTPGMPADFQWHDMPGRVLISALQAKPGAEFILARESRLSVITDLQNRLDIAERGKLSGVLAITLEGNNPQRIARILNAIGAAYVRQNTERKAAEAEKSLAFLDDFLPQLKHQMEESEQKYTQFRDRHGTFDLTTEGSLSLNKSAALQTQLLELEQRRRELSAQFTPAHPTLRVVDEQISALKKEIATLLEHIKTLPDLEQQLLTLMRDVKVNGELYVSLLNSAQQLRLIKEGKVGNVRVVDVAAVPEEPIKPKRPLVLTIAVVVGLVLGVALALLRNMLRTGIVAPREIESRLGLPVFAAIPHSPPQVKLQQAIQARAPGKHVLANIAAQDVAVESLRSLRTALQFAMLDAPNNIVVLTSPSPGVGKSFVSVNFSAVLGAANKRVLLIDADLRRGHSHQYFGVPRDNGLSELISGNIALDQAVHKDVMPNMDLITTGILPPNPAELLLSESAARILEKVSADYDVVLLDTTPILAVSDTMALASRAGTVFLLARSEMTTLMELEESAKRLRRSGAQVKGVLFNDFSIKGSRYGAQYYRSLNYGT